MIKCTPWVCLVHDTCACLCVHSTFKRMRPSNGQTLGYVQFPYSWVCTQPILMGIYTAHTHTLYHLYVHSVPDIRMTDVRTCVRQVSYCTQFVHKMRKPYIIRAQNIKNFTEKFKNFRITLLLLTLVPSRGGFQTRKHIRRQMRLTEHWQTSKCEDLLYLIHLCIVLAKHNVIANVFQWRRFLNFKDALHTHVGTVRQMFYGSLDKTSPFGKKISSFLHKSAVVMEKLQELRLKRLLFFFQAWKDGPAQKHYPHTPRLFPKVLRILQEKNPIPDDDFL